MAVQWTPIVEKQSLSVLRDLRASRSFHPDVAGISSVTFIADHMVHITDFARFSALHRLVPFFNGLDKALEDPSEAGSRRHKWGVACARVAHALDVFVGSGRDRSFESQFAPPPLNLNFHTQVLARVSSLHPAILEDAEFDARYREPLSRIGAYDMARWMRTWLERDGCRNAATRRDYAQTRRQEMWATFNIRDAGLLGGAANGAIAALTAFGCVAGYCIGSVLGSVAGLWSVLRGRSFIDVAKVYAIRTALLCGFVTHGLALGARDGVLGPARLVVWSLKGLLYGLGYTAGYLDELLAATRRGAVISPITS